MDHLLSNTTAWQILSLLLQDKIKEFDERLQKKLVVDGSEYFHRNWLESRQNDIREIAGKILELRLDLHSLLYGGESKRGEIMEKYQNILSLPIHSESHP